MDARQKFRAYDEDPIFHDLLDPVEDVQEYRSGGYHPIYLGDHLRNGKYLILRKLGYGSYSTVWLAKDEVNSDLVALKVMTARCGNKDEINIYERLVTGAVRHPGQAHVMMLKDHFSIKGPNGIHQCLVHEIMGPSITSLRIDRVSGESFEEDQQKRFTLPAARTMIYQALLGLDFLHTKRLVHGDFYADNLLLSLRDLSEVSMDDLQQSRNEVSAPVERLNGELSAGDPRILALNQPLREWIAVENDLQIKISDLGNSFFEGSPPTSPQTPVNVRSPELLFHNKLSAEQDIWAFGCLLFLLLTNSPLFDLLIMDNENDADDDHIIQMVALLGPLPKDLKNSWPRYRKYFNEKDEQTIFEVDYASSLGSLDDLMEDEGFNTSDIDMADNHENVDETMHHGPRRRNIQKGIEKSIQDLYPSLIEVYKDRVKNEFYRGSSQSLDTTISPTQPPLKDRWMQDKYTDIAPEESEAIADLLQKMFRYDPAERLTTGGILNHPWIVRFCMGENNGTS